MIERLWLQAESEDRSVKSIHKDNLVVTKKPF